MYEKLTEEETKQYLVAWRKFKDKKSRDILISNNIRLVTFIAKKYLGKGLSYDEILSAGSLGLMNAINKFDYEDYPLNTFSTYISTAIENQIKRDLNSCNKHNHVLSFEEPLGTSKDGDEMTLGQTLGTDIDELTENVDVNLKKDILIKSLKCLTTREKEIILLRYGLNGKDGKTLEEIAEIFNCSRQTILNQERKALIKMHHPRNTRKLKDFVD